MAGKTYSRVFLSLLVLQDKAVGSRSAKEGRETRMGVSHDGLGVIKKGWVG